MLSKWPLNLSHGPAIEIWSVVHLPFALISSLSPIKFSPSHARNGSRICNLLLSGDTKTFTWLPSSAGA